MSAKGNRKRSSPQTCAPAHPHRDQAIAALVRTEQAARDVSASSRASIEERGDISVPGSAGSARAPVLRPAEHVFEPRKTLNRSQALTRFDPHDSAHLGSHEVHDSIDQNLCI